MEQSSRRAEAFSPVRERVAQGVNQRLDDKTSLQLAIASAMRSPDEVIGFMFSQNVARQALQKTNQLALTRDEWAALFGGEATPLRDGGLGALVQSREFQPGVKRIAQALRCTVNEIAQAQVWMRPWGQTLCYVAIHLNEPEVTLESVLGTVVKADSRRMEELHSQIDDDGCETMLMASAIMALSECVL